MQQGLEGYELFIGVTRLVELFILHTNFLLRITVQANMTVAAITNINAVAL
jgi:hypothetical protein